MNDDMINEHQDIIKTFDLAMFPPISGFIMGKSSIQSFCHKILQNLHLPFVCMYCRKSKVETSHNFVAF